MQKTLFFSIFEYTESVKQQYFFEIFYNIIIVFAGTFDQFNAE